MTTGIADMPEPNQDDEETTMIVSKPEPKKRRLMKVDEKKKKKRTSELAKLVEATSEGEKPTPSSSNDSLKLIRIVKSIVEDVGREPSQHGSEPNNVATQREKIEDVSVPEEIEREPIKLEFLGTGVSTEFEGLNKSVIHYQSNSHLLFFFIPIMLWVKAIFLRDMSYITWTFSTYPNVNMMSQNFP